MLPDQCRAGSKILRHRRACRDVAYWQRRNAAPYLRIIIGNTLGIRAHDVTPRWILNMQPPSTRRIELCILNDDDGKARHQFLNGKASIVGT
jgi:hypothetical protein